MSEIREHYWETSVQELMFVFRDALADLIPFLKQVRIPIGVTLGVDAWDDITEILFRHMVIEAIRNTEPLEVMNSMKFAEYEVRRDDYSNISFIGVDAPDVPGHRAFHSFVPPAGHATTIDDMLYVDLDHTGRPIGPHPLRLPVAAARFRAMIREAETWRPIEHLKVVL